MIILWILLWLIGIVYVVGYGFAVAILWLSDPYNKLSYLVVALAWPLVGYEYICGNWK